MKISKLIVVAILMMFSGIHVNAQKKKPAGQSKSGPMVMPANTEEEVFPSEQKFKDMLSHINKVVTFEYDENYKNGKVYIDYQGKPKLMFKIKSDDSGVDTKLKARIYHNKVYSLDGKTLLFTYETETAATSLIKIIYNSPEKKSYIIDFSKIYGSDEYTIGKSETFKKYPIFLYHSYYTTEK